MLLSLNTEEKLLINLPNTLLLVKVKYPSKTHSVLRIVQIKYSLGLIFGSSNQTNARSKE